LLVYLKVLKYCIILQRTMWGKVWKWNCVVECAPMLGRKGFPPQKLPSKQQPINERKMYRAAPAVR